MNLKVDHIVKDYITDKPVKNMGSEKSRQIFERFLVNKKGWEKKDIQIDQEIIVQFKGEDYVSKIDLLIFAENRAFMAVTCVAGSIGSYEREILAGARLIFDYQIPFAVSTDAEDAIIMDTLTGKKYSAGLDQIPSKAKALELLDSIEYQTFDADKKEREMIIFRSFNMERML